MVKRVEMPGHDAWATTWSATMYDDYGRSLAVGRSWYATLVSFPVCCFILTLLTDLAYWASASYIWETVSVWLLTIGLVVAGFTILAGLADLLRSRKTRGLGQPWLQIVGHAVAFVLSLVNVFVHSRDGYTAVVPQGLILSALVVLVLLATAILARPVIDHQRVGDMA